MPEGFPHFKAVLFDVDGTLIDSLPALIRGLGDMFERFNDRRPSEAEIKNLIGMPLIDQFALYRSHPPTPQEQEEMMAFTVARFERYKDLEREYEPAVAALRICKEAGLKTAFVTSKNALEIEPFLKRFEPAKFADTIICSSDVEKPKPDPECALLACERLGVRPSEAIYIGDSVYDLGSARAAGIFSVAVAYGSGKREDLEAEMPDLLLDTPEELLTWIKNSISITQHVSQEKARSA